MNSDIQRYEKKKLKRLKKTHPDEYEIEVKKLEVIEGRRKLKNRKKRLRNLYMLAVTILLCLLNAFGNGPAFLYLLFGLGPLIINKISPVDIPKE